MMILMFIFNMTSAGVIYFSQSSRPGSESIIYHFLRNFSNALPDRVLKLTFGGHFHPPNLGLDVTPKEKIAWGGVR